ncbi:MAG: acetamidase/formamidase family protein [Firmicutes bacterium]|nr:acetamidase/formamidase family protein [Bacillota bacterium]
MKLTTDKAVFSFYKGHEAVASIDAPATIDVATKDCFSNQLREPEDTIEGLNWDATNPATGPVFVNGAEPGDTLKVTINKIDVDEKGTVCALENEGTLGHIVSGNHVKIVHIEDGHAVFTPEIRIPVKPMIGVIGVAPADEAVGCGTPGHHGGNMDNTMVAEGATLYFPVATEGALFGLGDVHAVMGDGEIGVTGLEIPAEINLTIELIKGKAPEYPVLENEECFSIIVSKETVDEATVRATELMHDFLVERMDLASPDIIMLMSLVGDVEICQIVDPLKTVRFVFPKKYMTRAEF